MSQHSDNERLRIQALGAAISRRDWHAVEVAHAAIRDEYDRRGTVLDEAAKPAPGGPAIMFGYTNWRGEYDYRQARIKSVRFGSSKWHKEPQFLLLATDLDKNEDREFAIKDIEAIHVLSEPLVTEAQASVDGAE